MVTFHVYRLRRLLMATINKFGNKEFKIDSFHHSIAIEETQDGGLIVHNDRNGEGFSINGSAIKALKAKSGVEGLKQFILAFGLRIPELRKGLPERVYNAVEHIHSELKRVFNLRNHSDICLLSESLNYAH